MQSYKFTISVASSSAFSFANRSASLARLSLSLREKMATDRALFTSFCFSLDFLAAISAARFSSSSVVGAGVLGAGAGAGAEDVPGAKERILLRKSKEKEELTALGR